MKTLTASDKSALIKMASELPKGDEVRKAILAGLEAAKPDKEIAKDTKTDANPKSHGQNKPDGWKTAASGEPIERALERMNDAVVRGGMDGMIRATATRLKATKDPSKALGIAKALEKYLLMNPVLTGSQEAALKKIQSEALAMGQSGGGVVSSRQEVPGPGGSVVDRDNGRGGEKDRAASILPAGFVNVITGENQYWDKGVIEVWEDPDRRLFGVCTWGTKPTCGVGSRSSFKHDQTWQMLRYGARMIGWFTIDPNGFFGGKIPKSGKLPVSTYK